MTADVAPAPQNMEARIDKLTQALFQVACELWVIRDRQALLEQVLAEKGIDAVALIDSYRPDAALAARLTAQREAFIANILSYLAPDV
ncbi:MAG: hypothetical protein ACXWLJ_01325 [Rhizomicrobium sp.]